MPVSLRLIKGNSTIQTNGDTIPAEERHRPAENQQDEPEN